MLSCINLPSDIATLGADYRKRSLYTLYILPAHRIMVQSNKVLVSPLSRRCRTLSKSLIWRGSQASTIICGAASRWSSISMVLTWRRCDHQRLVYHLQTSVSQSVNMTITQQGWSKLPVGQWVLSGVEVLESLSHLEQELNQCLHLLDVYTTHLKSTLTHVALCLYILDIE